MTISTLNEILMQELQKERNFSIGYLDYLKELFNIYKKQLKQISIETFKEELPENVDIKVVELEINKSIDALLYAYNCYMNGKITTAITIMKNSFLADGAIQTYRLLPDQKWFRVRTKGNKSNGFTPKEMFHVPFEMRTSVVNYRYSISGLPCLYLGNTILSCWEEMHCPALDELVVSRVEIEDNTINVIDLRLPKQETSSSVENESDNIKRTKNYLLLKTWPLIIACSIKTITPDAPFKFEYVHPQLLMLALMDNCDNCANCWGIVYSSTHFDTNMFTDIAHYTNIAIPVRSTESKGSCKVLASKFKITRGVSFMEAEIKKVFDSDIISYDSGSLIFANYSDGTIPYNETKFGQLETFLKNQIKAENVL